MLTWMPSFSIAILHFANSRSTGVALSEPRTRIFDEYAYDRYAGYWFFGSIHPFPINSPFNLKC